MIKPRLAVALLIVVATLALPGSSRAQLLDSYGMKVGAVSASATDNLDDFDRRTGLTASVFAEKRLLPFLSLIGEVGYVQRGFIETQIERTATNEVVGTVEANTQLDYLTIPVMAKLEYGLAPATLYALAGPRLDILLSRDAGTFEFSSGTFESQVADAYGSPAVGGTVGVGITTTNLLPARLLLGGRYELDFTDSFVEGPRETRNTAFTVVVGVAF